MTSSLWRFSHLTLALITFLFLIVASLTGVILAFDAAQEKSQPYRVDDFSTLNLAKTLPKLSKVFPEIIEITVDHNQFVILEGVDDNGEDIKVYIDPKTGKILGKPVEKSEFINWVTALHRSLFLKETGRFAVGVVSFLLMIISITGLILIIKRQNGIKHIFSSIKKDFFSQYLHVVSGRILLIPIIVVSATGTYLFLNRFELIPKSENIKTDFKSQDSQKQIAFADFPVFRETKFNTVKKIEFPFTQDDPEEFFILKLKDKEITVNQITGEVLKEEKYAWNIIYENLSMTFHTGRGSILWSIILGLSSLGILMFIYSGFVITFKRTKNKTKNKFKSSDAEIIILVGSENGSTLGFASKIHTQLLENGKKSFISDLNKYTLYPKAQHLIIFTSTYGLGEAPTNSSQFKKLLKQNPQSQNIQYSVVGFGSKLYNDYCRFAIEINQLLSEEIWTEQFTDLVTVNDKSVTEFVEWAKTWSYKAIIPLATAPSLYQEKTPTLKKMLVTEKTEIIGDSDTFKVIIKPNRFTQYSSGDLLAIYPENGSKERFYSIGKVNNKIQLIIKLHQNGAGSGFLFNLKENQSFKARIIKNSEFHLPKNASEVIMISNGTGIAPFLGMIGSQNQSTKKHLYCGFRKENDLTKQYRNFALECIKNGNLETFNIAFSREKNSYYVMDLIKKDASFFIRTLENGGFLMICGALKMQHDVEETLENLCKKNGLNYSLYKLNGQILSDCY